MGLALWWKLLFSSFQYQVYLLTMKINNDHKLQVLNYRQLKFEPSSKQVPCNIVFHPPWYLDILNNSLKIIWSFPKAVTCGASSLGRRGIITSPDYPADYESDTTCNWSLASSSNIRISFVVQDMDTEEGMRTLNNITIVKTTSYLYIAPWWFINN